ncbi:dnaJ homolog subfamily C member 24 isoform X3 [Hemicordylus capensis]|uniref:dnaJ homolog subfamily C member 24 isoform X3 n=1 Tax=Hemicordylus capensis TaxID=884348 RepID=UPI0023048ED6|nr:dnaJ homolog subfamily C member 24 isoform X3 [Hemicordylus capensis]
MAFEELSKKDWYSILGAEPSDNLTELKRKYQKLVLLHHPDKQSADVPAGEVEARMQRFIEIDRAWKILGNEETKKAYDLQRRDDQCYSLACRCGGTYTVCKNEAEDISLVSCDSCSLLIEILQ